MFEFADEDLKSNKRGLLTKGQREWLKSIVEGGIRLSDMLKNAELKVAEGKIELDQEYSSKAGFTSYYVYVGRKKFGFTESMNHIFTEGVKYRVYYVKASAYELIMSHERI